MFFDRNAPARQVKRKIATGILIPGTHNYRLRNELKSFERFLLQVAARELLSGVSSTALWRFISTQDL